MTWEEAEIDAFCIVRLLDPSLSPEREPSESESQIITEVNVQKGVMKVEGHIGLIHPNEVTTWPWELE